MNISKNQDVGMKPSNPDPFFRDIIDPTGIYAAIDTYDMSEIVREATKALNLKETDVFHRLEEKSRVKSREVRLLGNESFKAGKKRKAIALYNKALVLAPKFSEEMVLALSNRSAVFFSIRYYTACLKDIHFCFSLGCSEAIAQKLTKRRIEALPCARFQNMEFEIHSKYGNKFIDSYLRLNERNADVPCAHAGISFETNGVKVITAGAEIQVGTVVAIEKAYTSTNSNDLPACYYCNKPELCLYPCDGCCQALFCGEECRDRCMKEYHCIECQIVDYLGKIYYDDYLAVLMTRTAIKMSLKMTWDEFNAASTNIGASKMKAATVKQAFHSEEPLSILSYIENEHFPEGRIYYGSILCARILNALRRLPNNYFPRESAKCVEAMDAMARVMLQLHVTFSSMLIISHSAYNIAKQSYDSNVSNGCGWFAMSSKLKHSCEPNLFVLGLNDSVALIALRTIKRGEELTISHGGIFYHLPATGGAHFTMMKKFVKTGQMCAGECRACRHNWNSYTAVEVKMTKKQNKIMNKLTKCFTLSGSHDNNENFKTVCAVLDEFPFNSKQHFLAYRNWLRLLAIVSIISNNITYVTDNEPLNFIK